MKKNKRTWFTHYDSLPLEVAIKVLTDSISQIKGTKTEYEDNSFFLDLIAQRDEYKRRLKK